MIILNLINIVNNNINNEVPVQPLKIDASNLNTNSEQKTGTEMVFDNEKSESAINDERNIVEKWFIVEYL